MSLYILLGIILGSLFNGISTFVGYSLPKPSLEMNSGGTILTITGRYQGNINHCRLFNAKSSLYI